LDSRERVHLEWMFENQPSLVRELHHHGQLYEHLDNKNQQALRRVDQLKQQRGLSEREAFEVASQEILAPADGPAFSDQPPEPVPVQEQEAVYRKLLEE
jgi:transposase